jgi:Zn-finger nucleic acid-binding protein
MKCPICTGIDLKIAERQGVEIDYCPECRGVWLDRGELDKIIERATAQTPIHTQMDPQKYHSGNIQQQYGKQDHDDHNYAQNGQHKKRSWWSDLFD